MDSEPTCNSFKINLCWKKNLKKCFFNKVNIELGLSSSVKKLDKQNMFDIIDQSKKIHSFQAKDEEEMLGWIDYIEKTINPHLKKTLPQKKVLNNRSNPSSSSSSFALNKSKSQKIENNDSNSNQINPSNPPSNSPSQKIHFQTNSTSSNTPTSFNSFNPSNSSPKRNSFLESKEFQTQSTSPLHKGDTTPLPSSTNQEESIKNSDYQSSSPSSSTPSSIPSSPPSTSSFFPSQSLDRGDSHSFSSSPKKSQTTSSSFSLQFENNFSKQNSQTNVEEKGTNFGEKNREGKEKKVSENPISSSHSITSSHPISSSHSITSSHSPSSSSHSTFTSSYSPSSTQIDEKRFSSSPTSSSSPNDRFNLFSISPIKRDSKIETKFSKKEKVSKRVIGFLCDCKNCNQKIINLLSALKLSEDVASFDPKQGSLNLSDLSHFSQIQSSFLNAGYIIE